MPRSVKGEDWRETDILVDGEMERGDDVRTAEIVA